MKYESDDKTVTAEGIEVARLVGVFGVHQTGATVHEATLTSTKPSVDLSERPSTIVLISGMPTLKVLQHLLSTLSPEDKLESYVHTLALRLPRPTMPLFEDDEEGR